MSAPLEHRHYDVFTLPDKPAELHPDGLMLSFGYDREGAIDRIAAPLEPTVADIVFKRVAAGEVLDPAFRQQCVGAFATSGQTIVVALDAVGQLTMTITGQPSRRLLPAHARTFQIEGFEGYRCEFQRAASGEVDRVVFHQPNGTFVAQRLPAADAA